MKDYIPGQKIRACYRIPIYIPIFGWAAESVEAELEVITPIRARVISIEMNQNCTQIEKYRVKKAYKNEIGTIKIIHDLQHVEVIE